MYFVLLMFLHEGKRTYDQNLTSTERKHVKTEQGLQSTNTSPITQNTNRKTLGVDLAEFAHHLDGSDLTDDEKREYLATIWQIEMIFADLGYGLNATQPARGNLFETLEKEGFLSCDSLDLEEYTTSFEQGAQS